MRRPVLVVPAVLGPPLVALSFAGTTGCGRHSEVRQSPGNQPALAVRASAESAEPPAPRGALSPSALSVPAPGQSVRVGGDLSTSITGASGDYRSGPCRIDTPLPQGYPAPTPPGAIDLKTYPAVRLAEVAGSGNPDRGMNRAFWPLFNHIKRHDMAMTSPVEMTYSGIGADPAAQPQAWNMAFLYRTPDMNATGVEGSVTVRDAQPTTVLAAGLKGDYSMSLVERGRRTVQEWLASNPQWVIAGDWRSLYYNGPALFFWNKWAEVQVPVRPAATDAYANNAVRP